MKKLLLTSLLMLCASLAYANSGCGGGGCDSDKKDGKADSTQSTAVLAGSCGDKSDDKKDGKADSTQSNAVIAGAGCGDKCGDKKDGKSDFTVRQAAIV
jgi:hypothetical protein